jgi:hypothetical protein
MRHGAAGVLSRHSPLTDHFLSTHLSMHVISSHLHRWMEKHMDVSYAIVGYIRHRSLQSHYLWPLRERRSDIGSLGWWWPLTLVYLLIYMPCRWLSCQLTKSVALRVVTTYYRLSIDILIHLIQIQDVQNAKGRIISLSLLNCLSRLCFKDIFWKKTIGRFMLENFSILAETN